MIRIPLLAVLILTCATAWTQEEEFELKDGRLFTGTYDAETRTLSFRDGKIRGSLHVHPADITARRPVASGSHIELFTLTNGKTITGIYSKRDRTITLADGVIALKDITISKRQAADNNAALTSLKELPSLTDHRGLPVELILHDGRQLQGWYDRKQERMTIAGKITATLTITAEQIRKQRAWKPSTDLDSDAGNAAKHAPTAELPEASAQPDTTDKHAVIAAARKNLREAEAHLVALRDEARHLLRAFTSTSSELTASKAELNTARQTYKRLLLKRDDLTVAGKTIPQSVTTGLERSSQTMKVTTKSVQELHNQLKELTRKQAKNQSQQDMWLEFRTKNTATINRLENPRPPTVSKPKAPVTATAPAGPKPKPRTATSP